MDRPVAATLITAVAVSLALAPGLGAAAFANDDLEQTITFEPVSDHTVGDPNFAVSASASSGLDVQLSATPKKVCTIAAGLVHIAGKPGTCKVTASQPGDNTYAAAAPVQRSFEVISRAMLLFKSVKPKNNIKPGGILKPTVRVTASGRSPSGTVTYLIDGTFADTDYYPAGSKRIMSQVTAPMTPGKHIIKATFTDEAGSHQVATCRDRSFRVKAKGGY